MFHRQSTSTSSSPTCSIPQKKRYLAVERIAKEINKSERYVWKALALLENPTKLLESED
jgi:hypothetical protein